MRKLLFMLIATISVSAAGQTNEDIVGIGLANVPSIPVKIGTSVKLSLNWQAKPLSGTEYKVFVNFVSAAGKLYSTSATLPPGGTSRWSGEVTYDQIINLPANMPAGSYQILSGLTRFVGTWETLSLVPGLGIIESVKFPNQYVIGNLEVSSTAPPPPSVPVPAPAPEPNPTPGTGTSKTLIQRLDPELLSAGAGSSVSLTLSLDAVPANGDYKLFVNFLADSGKVYGGSAYVVPVATSRWSGPVVYAQNIVVPSMPAGTYKVLVGFTRFTGIWEYLSLTPGPGVTEPKLNQYAAGELVVGSATSTPPPVIIPAPSPTAGLRILPLGDSITDGFKIPGSYRTGLYRELTSIGKQINFVGSKQNGTESLPDKDHEGHSGWRIDQIDANINNYMQAFQPDVVLLMLGTNDVIQDNQLATAPQRLMALIDKIRAKNPRTIIYVSNLYPIGKTYADRLAQFNAAVTPLIKQRQAAGEPVRFVEMNVGMLWAETYDGVHPNEAGYAKIVQRWFEALRGDF